LTRDLTEPVRELVNDVEHPELAVIVGAVLDKFVRPHVIAILRPQRMQDPSEPAVRCRIGKPGTSAPRSPPLGGVTGRHHPRIREEL